MFRSQKKVIFLTCIVVILLVAISWIWLKKIDEDSRQELGESLTTVLNTTHQAVKSWVKENKAFVDFWSNSSLIRQSAHVLIGLSHSKEQLLLSDVQAGLRAWFEPLQQATGYQGYSIIGPDNINVASSRDENIGVKNLLFNQQQFLQRIWRGEIAVSLPERSDVPLPDRSGTLVDNLPTMFVGAPIKDEAGKVLAIMTFRINPTDDFTDILQQGRIGKTGETYAFDSRELLISNSRYNDQLRSIGHLEQDEEAILNIHIKNPGIDYIKGRKNTFPEGENFIVATGSKAVAGYSGINLDGYEDYRRVPVVGAWLWDDELGFGISTKLDDVEAYQILRKTRFTIVTLTLLLILLLIGISFIVINNNARKRAQRFLEESNQYNRMLFEESSIGQALCQLNGDLVDVNTAFASIIGRTVEEAKKLSYWEITPDKYTVEEQAQLENLNKTGRYGPYEKEYIHADGHFVPVRLSGRIFEKDGEKFIWSSVEDITEQQRSKIAIKESEARLANFFEASFEGIFFHEDGRILDVNPATTSVFGYYPDETVGRNLLEFVTPEFREIVAANMATGEERPYEVGVIAKDGSTIYVEVRAKTMVLHGKQVRVAGLHDITERKLTEDALRASEERFRKLVEESPAGIRISVKGQIRYVNLAYLRMFGYEEKTDLSGTSFLDNIVPEYRDEISKQVLRRFKGDNVPSQYETIGLKQDGTTFPFEVVVNLIDLPDGLASVAFLTDLSQRRQAEEALQRSDVLEKLATGASFKEILNALVINAEKHNPDMFCLVSILDRERSHLCHGAANKLPGFYVDAIDGVELGTDMCSCAAAAYFGKRVIVEDISSHPNWENFRDLAEKAGLSSCWSEPIISSTGDVLGTFAIYYTEQRLPQQQDLHFIQDSARLASIAIEFKQSEEQLKASERELRGILDSLQDVYYRADNQGCISHASPSALKVFGYHPEEVIGQPSTIVWRYPEQRLELLNALQAGGGFVQDFEREGVRKDGSTIWVSINAHFYHDSDGQIAGIEGTLRDVTKRKQAEYALREIVEGTSPVIGHDFFRILVKHLANALNVRYAYIGELIDIEHEHVQTRAVWTGNEYSTNFEYALAGTPCENVVGQVLCCYPKGIQQMFPKDHLLVEMGAESYIGAPLFDSKGNPLGILAILHDEPLEDTSVAETIVSIFAGRAAVELERKHVEEQGRKHQEQVAHMARLNTMGEMVTGLAHELNQPLAAIVNYASAGKVMLDANKGDPEKLKNVLQSVSEQALRASEIIRHLRKFIKKQDPQKTLVSLNVVVEEVLSFMQAEIKKNGARLELRLDNELPEVYVDAIQIEQVLVNLVQNSLQAMEATVEDQRQLIIRTYLNEEGIVQLELSDTGPGINEDMLRSIFNQFVSSKGVKGMGLGLSISRSIIEAHGGRLWAQSEPGKGATFFFMLPQMTE